MDQIVCYKQTRTKTKQFAVKKNDSRKIIKKKYSSFK